MLNRSYYFFGFFFFFQAEDGIRDVAVTGVQTCALPISAASDVPLNFVMMSPTLRTALSAGPPGVTPSILAAILSGSGLGSVLTTTPIRPRWSLIMNARTRGGRGGQDWVLAIAARVWQVEGRRGLESSTL